MAETTLGRGPENCALCGLVAQGSARIGDLRYCHGDDQDPSCYEEAQWDISHGGLDGFGLNIGPRQP